MNDLFSGFVGAVIGGGASLLATAMSNRHQLELQRRQHRRRIHGILHAISNELEVLGQFYDEEAGKSLDSLKSGEPYQVRFCLTEKYFIVYPNNTGLVAQLDDRDLCKAIIVVYNKANFLIETFRINNHYLEQRAECERLSRDEAGSKYIDRGNKILSLQIAHAARLKAISADLRSDTRILLAKITAYLERHEAGI
jgi:hypothetical protein